MAKIEDIIELYSKESKEFVKGKISASASTIGSNELEIGETLIPNSDEIKPNTCLFGYKDSALRIKPEDYFDPESFSPKNLYYISDYEKSSSVVTVSFIPFCRIEERESIEICFDTDYILKRGTNAKKQFTPKDITKFLTNDYVFMFGGKSRIFIKRYPNSNDFELFGFNGWEAIIRYDEDKHRYKVKQDKPSNFPKDHVAFLRNIECMSFNSVSFCEESAAKESHQEVLSSMQNGTALLSLWSKYSELELKKAKNLQESIGDVHFHVIIYNSDCTKVQMELSESQREAVEAHYEDLLLSAMEVEKMKVEGRDGKKPLPFKIKAIDTRHGRFDFFDEYNIIPEKGTMRISTVGDESIDKRRNFALDTLVKDPTILMRNTILAIEGKADAMYVGSSKKNEIKPVISGRTREYLKDKFGIDHLTDDQEEAVRIALNTPDIAIIQGPPGTGKSTVIAAICNRLIEDAEKKNKDKSDKVILVSAFQNDTVEHIASKIDTLGLPTVKVGKDVVGNIAAEEALISAIRLKIDNSIHRLPPEKDMERVSIKLGTIRDIFEKEKNIEDVKHRVESILKDNQASISDELWEDWRRMFPTINVQSNDKLIKALKGLPTTADVYLDDGYSRILKLQAVQGFNPTEEENEMLEEAPLNGETPSEEFLSKLQALKEKYLAAAFAAENDSGAGDHLELNDWFRSAIRHFSELEESAAETDEEVFLISVLKSLRDDLEGNSKGIRESIKEYGESIAATNQVAGGQEMAKYRSISNVILEEAARSNPLDLIIPVSKAQQRIILVGDQKQLPHLLENDIADDAVAYISDEVEKGEMRKKYEESLFGILFNNLSKINSPKRCITLTKQFRMHPAIGDFISKLYYDDKLEAGMGYDIQAMKREHGLQLPWAKDKVAVFCNVDKSKGMESGRKGKWRVAEAKRIVKILNSLKTDPAFERLSVGIITFYSKQVDSIFAECEKAGYAVKSEKDGSYSISPDFKETPDHREKLRIGTVDSFQGKEFDIVILSTVRSNETERTDENYRKVFGFLTLENRLNVAFSRAQRMLIVTGDGDMFADEYAMRHVEGLYEYYNHFSKDVKYGSSI